MTIWQYANPRKFIATADKVLPWIGGLAAICLAVGLGWGFYLSAVVGRQGGTDKRCVRHGPAPMMASNAWSTRRAAALIWLRRRHHVSALAAKGAAPVGITFTLMALGTGAIWGQPMWGTWWAWDPRLTSFLILFLFYLGYVALWQAIENPDTAADLTSILCLVGSVFALLSRYAVNFWNQGLHQGASLSLDREENVADVFWYPALVAIAGFVLLFVALVLVRTKTEIRARQVQALEARERMA